MKSVPRIALQLSRALLVLSWTSFAAPATVAAGIPPSTTTYREDFSSDPRSSGWKTFGQADLFKWDAEMGRLHITWDSRRPNSYFYRPVGTVLSRSDSFELTFDLTLQDIQVGVNTNKAGMFQIALGLLELRSATIPGFLRGSGTNAWNLVELDYFPDSGFGATVSPTIISSNIQFATGFTFPLELTTNDLFHVVMGYQATNRTLTTLITRNGEAFGPIQDAVAPEGFDFRVDSIAVMSYSDEGQDPVWGGSVLAHGILDNLALTAPVSPAPSISLKQVEEKWEVEFPSREGWTYTLEAAGVLGQWESASPPTPGTGDPLTLLDARVAASSASFYRVVLTKP